MLDLQAVSPSEFWGLSPEEASMILGYHVEQSEKVEKITKKTDAVGGLTDEDRKRIEDRRAKMRAKGVQVI